MLDKDPSLSKLAKKRRSDIYIPETNTTAEPLAFNAKKSDGLNISLCVADEVASWQGDAGLKMYEVLKSSFGARRQPLLLSISTAGYQNDSTYDARTRSTMRSWKAWRRARRSSPPATKPLATAMCWYSNN